MFHPHEMKTSRGCGCSAASTRTVSGFAVADQREMSHWRHRAALDQRDTAMSHRPVHQTLPGKLGAPSEPPCQWRECQFKHTTWTALGTDVIDQNKFAARLQHPDEIIQRSLGIRHRRHDILRHHGIEELIGEGEILGVHYRERLDIAQPHRPYALLRFAEHGLGYIDAA